MSAVLGLSGHYHDAAAALVVDGELVAFAQEERFSRLKHDPGTPVRAARWCLAHAGLAPGEVEVVAWHEKPLLKLERVLRQVADGFPRTAPLFADAARSFLGNKLWVGAHLAGELGVDPARIRYSAHHLSHAAAAFLASPFERAAVLCVDGVGELATTSLWRGEGTRLEPLAELPFPHSLGLWYSTATAFLGFEVNDGEYKLMGLAPYGQPRFREQVERMVRPAADGAFELDLDWFRFHEDPRRMWSERWVSAFGPPRDPREPPGEVHRDLAASVQLVLEERLLALVRALHARTGEANLCIGGGVALNATANGRICREGPFARVFVPPAAGDAGGALGAALLCAGVRARLRHAAWGQALDEARVGQFLADLGVPHRRLDPPELVEHAAERLAAGEAWGWVQGRFELGPRALGQRSILADPRDPAARDRLNRRIKHREPFRPFAPSVLATAAPAHFALPEPAAPLLPFMTCTVRATSGALPAATHVDGTARIQVVDPEVLPLFGALLEAFGRRTGVPALLNTSFNLAGEPIVASAADALATLRRSGLDGVVLGPFVVPRPDS